MTTITATRFPVWIPMTPMHDFVPPADAFVRGEGVHLWDEGGRRYLDGASGLWNVNLGHGHPAVIEAATRQLRTLAYAPTFRAQTTLPAAELALRLLDLAGLPDGRVFFTTSGSMAVDTALKLVRRRARLDGRPERDTVIALRSGYHGTSYGAMAVTGQDLDQDEYRADRTGTALVAPNDVDDLDRVLGRVGPRLAGVIVEPVLGNSALPLSAPFVAALQRACATHDALLVVDEVATGFGRTGTMLASTRLGLRPDLLLLSKALTNGALPLAAVVAGGRVCEAFDRPGCAFLHGETQSGNPVAAAAGLAVLDVMAEPDFFEPVAKRSERLDAGLRALVDAHPAAVATQGLGLMRSVRLRRPDGGDVGPAEVLALLALVRRRGVLAYGSESGIALLPPLTAGDDHIDQMVDAVADALDRGLT